jgi:hypothetical protein
MRSFLSSSLVLVVLALILSPNAKCKDKQKKSPPRDPQDAIEVVGHLPPVGGAVTRFLSTPHYSSYYLYVEHEGGKNVTLVDVSKTKQPVVLADIPSAPNGGSASLFAVTGTAALISEQTANVPVMSPQTIRIMDFSDPTQPKVAREFARVTAMSRDDQRGLIFLANPEGIWILHQSFALDPQVEREYAQRILYDHQGVDPPRIFL